MSEALLYLAEPIDIEMNAGAVISPGEAMDAPAMVLLGAHVVEKLLAQRLIREILPMLPGFIIDIDMPLRRTAASWAFATNAGKM